MKTRYIKYLALPLMLASAWSCTDMTEDAVNEATGGSTVKEIVLQLPELKTADTRTEFTVDEVNKTLKTAWAEGDVAGIFPTTGYNQVEFPISDSWGESVARFDGGDWALRANKSYAAYFPFNKANFERDASSIILSYEGQKQEYNGSISHLSDYDYLATGAAQADAYGSIYFQMQRLSSIVMLQLTFPEACIPTRIEITSDQDKFVTKANLDISSSTPQVSVLDDSSRFNLDLENIELTDDDLTLTLYLMMSPVAFQTGGSTWKVIVSTAENNFYDATLTTKDLEANKAYLFEASLEECLDFIAFADPEVERICLENWDINNDGRLSYMEATLIEDLGGRFKDNTDIISFDELQYFTGLTEVGGFEGCKFLESIIIPENVLSIGSTAFQGCKSLKTINIPESVTSIGGDAFSFSGLTSITLPESITTIGSNAFSFSGLASITIPKSITRIEENAFTFCPSLTSITIPEGVTSIGSNSFSYCPKLTSISLPEGLAEIGDGAFYGSPLETVIIPSSITNIGSEAFFCVKAEITEFPGYAYGWGINSDEMCLTTIICLATDPPQINGPFYISDDFLFSIYVPSESVNTYKEAWPKYADRIKANPETMDDNIIFADSNVKAICVQHWDTNHDGELSFAEAAAVTTISDYFYRSDITSFDEFQYFVNVTYLGSDPSGDGWYDEESSDPEVSFYYGAFEECNNLTKITLPEGLKTIGYGSFSGCAFSSIKIPDSCNKILDFAFSSCQNLNSVNIPDGVTYIPNGLFWYCSNLSQVTIPESITYIGDYAFKLCNSLGNVELPSGINRIGYEAFWCDMESMTIWANTVPVFNSDPNWEGEGDGPIGSFGYNYYIYVPSPSLNAYKEALPDIANRIRAIE